MIPPLKVASFSGIAPIIGARKLPENMAQVAENVRLDSGEIDPWKQPKSQGIATKSAQGEILSLHRMVDANGVDIWLNWTKDVDAVRGPIAGDTTQRTYFTGDNEPRVTNLTLATSGNDYPFASFKLGVSPPVTAPTVGHTGGTGGAISRSFVYTFVTEWGEESQPSPASALTAGKVDGTWNLSNLETAWLNTFSVSGASFSTNEATLTINDVRGLRVGEGIEVNSVNPTGYNGTFTLTSVNSGTNQIKYALSSDPGAYVSGGVVDRVAEHNVANLRKRIYWTETVAGETVYQLVDDIAAATTAVGVPGNATVGEPIPSADYDQPPTDMVGLVKMPNGMMAAFRENEILFCEPYKPYAWPLKYRLATNRPIVGLAVFETTLVVATKGVPGVWTGTHPESMSEVSVDGQWPCTSKRGIVEMAFGVMYPSEDGLILISPSGSGVATLNVLSRNKFKEFFPYSIFATKRESRYYAFFKTDIGARLGFIFDRTGQGAILVSININASAAYNDEETGDLYFVNNGEIMKWDDGDNGFLNYDWRSKIFVTAQPVNYAAARVDADFASLDVGPDAETAQAQIDLAFNQTVLSGSEAWPHQSMTAGCMNESMVNERRILGSKLRGGEASSEFNQPFLQFLYYCDGELRRIKNVGSNEPFRLKAGKSGTDHEIRVLGNIPVFSMEIAGSIESLGKV